MTGLYLYLFLVIPWQYLAPDVQSYGAAYKFLSLAQDVILLAIIILGWRHSSGRWRHFYGLLIAIIAWLLPAGRSQGAESELKICQ